MIAVFGSRVADYRKYQFWQDGSWSSVMPGPSSTDYFLAGNFMDVDIFYSPRHLTFMAVYMTTWVDNTFYYQYLQTSSAIRPSFAGGAVGSDYVENLVQAQWSQQQILYKTPSSLSGQFVYSGGVHQGYYGTDDITMGGTKMLLSWTAPTGQDPASNLTEYQILTAEADWA